MKISKKQLAREMVGGYAIAGHNDGMLAGPHHARIAANGPAIYADAKSAGLEAECRKAYLDAYAAARAQCEAALGPGKAYAI